MKCMRMSFQAEWVHWHYPRVQGMNEKEKEEFLEEFARSMRERWWDSV